MRVLISGFEPFGGRELNPTTLLIKSLDCGDITYPKELIVETLLLPVTFSDSYSCLKKKVQVFNPDVVMAFGQAAGRAEVCLEEVAQNCIDADIPDNAGSRPTQQKISPTGPEVYLSTLPLQGIESTLKAAGIPVKVSQNAGTYVCNYLFYHLMRDNQLSLRLCGFIHVPLLPEQAQGEIPSMSFEQMKKALEQILWYINY